MKRRITLLLCLLALSARADREWRFHNPNHRIPWANGGGYERCEYDWWIQNTGEPTDLYLNGLYQGSEYGTNDIGLAEAWAIHPQGVCIGVVDANTPHGLRVKAVAEMVSRNTVLMANLNRLYPDDIAAGISNFTSIQLKIIVVTTGFNFAHAGLSNACRYAESRNALVFCAVPNSGVSIDLLPDYPSSWASEISSIVPITSTDRNGDLYGPNAAAWGDNVTGAPGRNIICGDTETYTSGTSLATPIAAGCVAILMQYRRGFTASVYRHALWSSAVPAMGIRRIDAVKLLEEF